MYAPFFGLRHEPFSIAPDPRFLFMSERHREALAHLLYGLRGGGGFVLLTGDIGAGKTTVCRCFLEQIPKRCNVAYIFNPKLSVEELLGTVCEEFRIPMPQIQRHAPTVKDRVDALNHYLLRTHAVGQNNVLIIDEAQNLSPEVLEQLRLLTNLETSERKLLQIILIGQPELRGMLARPELEQLAQRVVARYHLDALSEQETQQYIAHRLSVAGMSKAMPFDSGALHTIYRLSRGIPRRINLLCDRALLGGYARGRTALDASVVRTAATEVFDTLGAGRRGWRGLVSGRHTRLGAVGAGACAAVLVGVAAWAIGGWSRTEPSVVPRARMSAQLRAASAAVASSQLSAVAPPPASSAAAPALAGLDWSALFVSEREGLQDMVLAWGLDLSDAAKPCQAAARVQLHCFRSVDGSLPQIRQLDRPVLLSLYRPSSVQAVHALLMRLDGDKAELRGSGGRRQTVALSALAGAWKGELTTLWRAPQGYGGRGDEDAVPVKDWVAHQLQKSKPPSGTAGDVRAQVAAFQLAQGLKPDGLVGPITLMQMNRVAGVPEPRLQH